MERAMEMVREVAPVARKLEGRDRDLARQLRRAAQSVALNLAEGRRRAGGDRRHLWRVAGGSTDEVRTALLVAEAFGYLGAGESSAALELCDRLVAMTWRMTH